MTCRHRLAGAFEGGGSHQIKPNFQALRHKAGGALAKRSITDEYLRFITVDTACTDMDKPLFFEDLTIGDRWRSRARTVTETDVVNFAGMTGDYDPLHVDHEYARQSPFGKPIAHGLLGLALVAGLGSNSPAVNSVAFVALRKWEFRKPIFIGDTVHAVNEIVKLADRGRRRGLVTWHRQLVNQRGEVLQDGIFETLVAKSPERTARVDRPAEERTPAKPHAARRKRKKKPGE